MPARVEPLARASLTLMAFNAPSSLTHSLEAVMAVLKPGTSVRQEPNTLRDVCNDVLVAKAAKGSATVTWSSSA